MHGFRLDATGYPLACQPAPEDYRHGQEHDHQHTPGGRGGFFLFTIAIPGKFLIVAHTDHTDLGVARSAWL
jgi:hypothetical protein